MTLTATMSAIQNTMPTKAAVSPLNTTSWFHIDTDVSGERLHAVPRLRDRHSGHGRAGDRGVAGFFERRGAERQQNEIGKSAIELS